MNNDLDEIASEENNPEISLSQEQIKEFSRRGYEVLHRLGSGKTGDVYLVRKNKEHIPGLKTQGKFEVAKVYKPQVDQNSPQAVIASSRRNLAANEHDISNQLSHRNIIEVSESFLLPGSQAVLMEKYYPGAIDLEKYLKLRGRPLGDTHEDRKVLEQILEGAAEFESKGYYHRDHKPSNILITDEGHVKICDLQLAERAIDTRESHLPTIGSAPYNLPEFLNSLIKGYSFRAKRETEVYSVAATLLFATTGKKFDYNLVFDSTGREIEIAGDKYKIKLKKGDKDLEAIDYDLHEKELKEMIKSAPKTLQRILYRSLSQEVPFDKRIKSLNELLDEFKKSKRSYLQRLGDGLQSGAKYFFPAMGFGALLGGAIALGIVAANREKNPTRREVIEYRENHKREEATFSLETISEDDRPFVNYLLVPSIKDAKIKLENLNETQEKEYNDLIYLAKKIGQRQGISDRESVSWLTACYLCQDEIKNYNRVKDKRIPLTFVPKSFVQQVSDNHRDYCITNNDSIFIGLRALKLSLTRPNIAEAYADYFSSDDERKIAVARSESINYLPGHQKRNDKYTGLTKGYQYYMDRSTRRLANMATGLYMITSDDGIIDFEKLDKMDIRGITTATRFMDDIGP